MNHPFSSLVDIGANLTHDSFDTDFDQVIERAQAAGVKTIMLTGTDLSTSQQAAQYSKQQPTVFRSTAGFHPHVASQWDSEASAVIRELVGRDEVVAIGECGLDFNRDFSPRETQLQVFEEHLKIAELAQKPLFLHQREAHEPFFALLERYRDKIKGGVVHCFTDSKAALDDYLALDMYIGITGWVCDERRGAELQEIVKYIPPDRLLIETDAPYLLPRTLRPKPKSRRNEPCHLVEVVRMLAQCTGREAEQIAEESTRNAHRLFGLPIGSTGT